MESTNEEHRKCDALVGTACPDSLDLEFFQSPEAYIEGLRVISVKQYYVWIAAEKQLQLTLVLKNAVWS